MGLDDLAPGNTKRARATAMKAFARFLRAEGVELDYVKSCILHDATGQCFVSAMDKFGMYLALHEGKAGKPLARHSCMQYYRQAKHWLLDRFPQHRVALEDKLLKMGRTLESFCVKREGGGFVKKATACTKNDLRRMMYYLYSNARCSSDYQDTALLSLLWYMFGRASDATHVRKQNISGLSIFPDADFAACPLYAIALALTTQAAPCADLLDHLPAQQPGIAATLGPDTPLLELLDSPATSASPHELSATVFTTASTPTIHTHVNRLLDRIAKPAGINQPITSHSFRRGGAQHANGSAELSDRWIFDRGAWNISTTNKAFNYVFNTSTEDHKVAKVLSGHDPQKRVLLADLTVFDAHTQENIAVVQAMLFSACQSLGSAKCNVRQRVIDVLTAYLILHYLLLKVTNPDEPAIKRLETCMLKAGFSLADLLAWSTHLLAMQTSCTQESEKAPTGKPSHETEERRITRHQASVIDHLIGHAKRQDDRLDVLEARVIGSSHSTMKTKRNEEEISRPTKSRKQAPVTYLRSTWFEWYAREPRLRSANGKKQKKSDSEMLIAFMKLFLGAGFSLDAQANTYRDVVMAIGLQAEANLLAFLEERSIASKYANAVLKQMRALHRAGELNDLISRYRRLLAAGAIRDPAPSHTQDILEPIAQKKQQ